MLPTPREGKGSRVAQGGFPHRPFTLAKTLGSSVELITSPTECQLACKNVGQALARAVT